MSLVPADCFALLCTKFCALHHCALKCSVAFHSAVISSNETFHCQPIRTHHKMHMENINHGSI